MKKHHGLVSLFVTEQPDRARQAADASLGVLLKPYDRDTVLRTLGSGFAGSGGAATRWDWRLFPEDAPWKWAADLRSAAHGPE